MRSSSIACLVAATCLFSVSVGALPIEYFYGEDGQLQQQEEPIEETEDNADNFQQDREIVSLKGRAENFEKLKKFFFCVFRKKFLRQIFA